MNEIKENIFKKAGIVYEKQDITIPEICKTFLISSTSFYRYIKSKNLKKFQRQKRSLSTNEKEIIQNLYLNKNLSILKISKNLKISRETVSNHLKEKKIIKSLSEVRRFQKRGIPKICQSEYPKIIEQYLNHKTYDEIAIQYNVSRTLIRNILKEFCPDFIFQGDKRKSQVDPLKEEIVKRYRNKESVKSIKESLNITYGKIDFCLKDESRKRKSCIDDLSQKDIEDILNLFKNKDILNKDIRKKYNLNNKSLRKILNLNGIKETRRTILSYFSEEDIKDIIEMYQGDFLIKEIAEKYNINNQALKKLLIKQNIKLREDRGLRSIHNAKESSRGISGIYKNHPFRSLLELCFIGQILMVKYKDDEWRSGENINDRIRYEDQNGKEKWYYPDFIVKNKIIIEVKPTHLYNDEVVMCKSRAARQFCKENKKRYIIKDMKVDLDFIFQEYQAGHLKITEKQLGRFKKRLSKFNLT